MEILFSICPTNDKQTKGHVPRPLQDDCSNPQTSRQWQNWEDSQTHPCSPAPDKVHINIIQEQYINSLLASSVAPGFECLWFAKMEREGLGNFTMLVISMSTKRGGVKMGPHILGRTVAEEMHIRHTEQWVVCFQFCEYLRLWPPNRRYYRIL